MSKIPSNLKYQLYESSVQNHECDIEFINKQYKKFFKKPALTFREDFGGTAAMACDWVKQSPDHKAWGIDLDPEPIAYGKENHYSRLNDNQKSRMEYIEGNVLADYPFKADITVAFNFSYFIFKERRLLVEYFAKVKEGLSKDGVFFVDIFGGTEARQELQEETEHDNHTYFWDCDSYNTLTEEVLYYIHFKDHKDGKMYRKAFTYDWRMWSVGEIKDAMLDAGFSNVVTYWEGTDDDGTGDGEFYSSKDEENCESWVTYIAAMP
ncbi:MAG: hypothetical protein BM556_07700 [Bacteriovorax sp. MedPE-SWde]|nr:MAG: hypothetical protein BM556_07700 [Bacteriovorax sp. MedPE-SWde]